MILIFDLASIIILLLRVYSFSLKNPCSDNLRDDEMSDSFQSEVPKARINLKLDLHTGGAGKKTELPLKLLVAGDFSHGQESAPLSERKKVNLNKNNFDSVLSEYSPNVNLTVKNTLAGDGSEENITLTFQSMKDFTPEQVSRQIPQLKAMLSMRNLLRDLKANLLDTPVSHCTNGAAAGPTGQIAS